MSDEYTPRTSLYTLSVIDAQDTALTKIGRALSRDELRVVQKCLEAGLNDCWYDIMKIAIDVAVEDPDIDHSEPLPLDYWPFNLESPLA